MNAHVCCSHRLTWLYTPARHSRKIGDHILSLNDSDLKELCAAYKMEAIAAKSRDQIKEELINLLIHADRNYDLTALAEHQAAVAIGCGGKEDGCFRGRQASNRQGGQGGY